MAREAYDFMGTGTGVKIRAGRDKIEVETKAEGGPIGAIRGSEGRTPGPGRTYDNFLF